MPPLILALSLIYSYSPFPVVHICLFVSGFVQIGVLVYSQDMMVVKRLEASTFVVCKSCFWLSYIHNVSNLFSCLQHAQVSHAKYSLQLVKLQKHLEMGKSSVSQYLIFIGIATLLCSHFQ